MPLHPIIYIVKINFIYQDDVSKEQLDLEEEWNIIDESVFNRVVNLHDQLFRLNSFVKTVSILSKLCYISNRITCFICF